MTPQLLTWVSDQRLSARSVIEIGAYNVNGSLRSVIDHDVWFGTDLRPGPCVDYVIAGEKLCHVFDGNFDALVIAETLEHCEDWKAVLRSGWRTLRNGGWCIITTPGPDFPRHEYPADYWRFTLEFWAKQLLKQEWMTGADFFYPHNGHACVVRKATPFLNDLEDAPVKAGT